MLTILHADAPNGQYTNATVFGKLRAGGSAPGALNDARSTMTEPIEPTPARPAPPLTEVRRLLDRYRRTEKPPTARRLGGPPVLSQPPERKRGD
jgi:hypothetical protein